MKILESSLLIPVGSSNEGKSSVSHLFEHILISKLIKILNQLIKGYTCEDYIFLFFQNIIPKEIVEICTDIEIDKKYLKKEKEILEEEIRLNKENPEEIFFYKIWKDTKYEKTPLGDFNAVKNISVLDVNKFKERIRTSPFYIFHKDEGAQILNEDSATYSIKLDQPLNILEKRNIVHQMKKYDVIYFEGNTDILFLVEKLLELSNRKIHIQFCEKKDMSVLFFETSCEFPDYNQVNGLFKIINKAIMLEVEQIKNIFSSRVVNELESVFFYNKSWDKRVKALFQNTPEQLFEIIRRLDVKNSERKN